MTIDKLKNEGHILLEEYLDTFPKHQRLRRDTAYKVLELRMKGKTPHFGQMKTKAEVMNAIGTLKKMIYERKKSNAEALTVKRWEKDARLIVPTREA
jgi:hypothetical protein